MTRFLSMVLRVVEPGFSQRIAQLEHAAGRPGADIRLTEDIRRRTRVKIAELGLDPHDTTGEELYTALRERLKIDEVRVRRALGIAQGSPSDEAMMRIRRFVIDHETPGMCFALKTSVARRLLRKKPPKAAMKRLGYRSVDSMLKHEQPAQVFAAAAIAEPAAWHRQFREQYTKLTPADFESRAITVFVPAATRWQPLADEFAAVACQHLLAFKELGAIVLLPVSQHIPGLAITTLLLVLEEMNAIRAHSSYAKLQQVRPGFGKAMRDVVTGEAYTEAYVAGQRVSWRTIQRYYAAHPDAYHPEIFEPHVQPEDLAWLHAEDTLAALQPALSFWQGTQALSILDGGQVVSCNALDVALNHCNNLTFGEHIARHVRGHIWHELMVRYLHQENLEAALRRQLSDTLSGQRLAPAFVQEEP